LTLHVQYPAPVVATGTKAGHALPLQLFSTSFTLNLGRTACDYQCSFYTL